MLTREENMLQSRPGASGDHHGNASISIHGISNIGFKLQPANYCRGDYFAFFLLRGGRGYYAAAFGVDCLFFGSGGGVSGTIPDAANDWRVDYGAGDDFGAGGRGFCSRKPGGRFRVELAEVQRVNSKRSGNGGRKN